VARVEMQINVEGGWEIGKLNNKWIYSKCIWELLMCTYIRDIQPFYTVGQILFSKNVGHICNKYMVFYIKNQFLLL